MTNIAELPVPPRSSPVVVEVYQKIISEDYSYAFIWWLRAVSIPEGFFICFILSSTEKGVNLEAGFRGRERLNLVSAMHCVLDLITAGGYLVKISTPRIAMSGIVPRYVTPYGLARMVACGDQVVRLPVLYDYWM
jgi:hypothetical protein